jgi:hypothetical protein
MIEAWPLSFLHRRPSAAIGRNVQVSTYPPVGGVATTLQRIPPTNPKSIDIALPNSAMKAAALAVTA